MPYENPRPNTLRHSSASQCNAYSSQPAALRNNISKTASENICNLFRMENRLNFPILKVQSNSRCACRRETHGKIPTPQPADNNFPPIPEFRLSIRFEQKGGTVATRNNTVTG